MYEVEFVPATWLERACWAHARGQRMEVRSRPVLTDRRAQTRRADDVAQLLRTLLTARAA